MCTHSALYFYYNILQYIIIIMFFIVPWSTGHHTTPCLYAIIVSADNRNELKSLSFVSTIQWQCTVTVLLLPHLVRSVVYNYL